MEKNDEVRQMEQPCGHNPIKTIEELRGKREPQLLWPGAGYYRLLFLRNRNIFESLRLKQIGIVSNKELSGAGIGLTGNWLSLRFCSTVKAGRIFGWSHLVTEF